MFRPRSGGDNGLVVRVSHNQDVELPSVAGIHNLRELLQQFEPFRSDLATPSCEQQIAVKFADTGDRVEFKVRILASQFLESATGRSVEGIVRRGQAGQQILVFPVQLRSFLGEILDSLVGHLNLSLSRLEVLLKASRQRFRLLFFRGDLPQRHLHLPQGHLHRTKIAAQLAVLVVDSVGLNLALSQPFPGNKMAATWKQAADGGTHEQ